MAAMTSFTTRCPVEYGRSGYNKYAPNLPSIPTPPFKSRHQGANHKIRGGNGDDDEDNQRCLNFGRSGYNKLSWTPLPPASSNWISIANQSNRGEKGDDDDNGESQS